MLYAGLTNVYPHILDITRLDTYVASETGYINNNPGRAIPDFTGGKQGYLDESAYTFVGGFGDVGIVVLGSTNLRKDLETLHSYAQQIR
jgi:D-alanyl-D-alanine carboxypeptidase